MNECISILLLFFIFNFSSINAQENKAWKFNGVVYDEQFNPMPYTHVIAKGTGQGDVTDTLGIFTLYVRNIDQLSFYNLACQDTSVIISKDAHGFYINLKRKRYSLREARIFNWGSTYGEFLEEVNRQGVPENEGKRIGLPRQDPDVISFDMDEKKLKSVGFLISSPVSFLYYNLSKYEKSARKAFKLEQDQEQIKQFEQTLSKENLAFITGLENESLEDFILYLNMKLQCNYQCSELQLITEIHTIWQLYQDRNAYEK